MRLQQYIHKQAAFNLLHLHCRLGLEADVIESLYILKIFHNLGIANFVSLLFIGDRNLWCAIQVYYYIDSSVLLENIPLVLKIHKNYIRDPSGLFSIISHVSLSMA